MQFQTKPEIALAQIRQAVAEGIPVEVVPGDEVYGSNREFPAGVAALKLSYSPAVRYVTTVWAGRRAQRLGRDETRQPWTVEQLARSLPRSPGAG